MSTVDELLKRAAETPPEVIERPGCGSQEAQDIQEPDFIEKIEEYLTIAQQVLGMLKGMRKR